MVSTFMSVVIFSGAVLQWPAGFISDKIGRRAVLIISSFGGVGAGLFLWQFAPVSQNMMLIGGALYGMFTMQVYGMSAAHANDFAEPHEFVAISGGLLLIYGLGSVFGPSTAPILMSQYGPSTLFAFTAAVHFTLAVYAVYRLFVHRVPNMKVMSDILKFAAYIH